LPLKVAISLSRHPLDLEAYSLPIVADHKPVDGRGRTAHESCDGNNRVVNSEENGRQYAFDAGQRSRSEAGQGAGKRQAKIYLTRVYTQFRDGFKNYRVLFGVPEKIETLHQIEGETDQLYTFAAGARFALDLWKRNAYGTIQWRCFVCEAVAPGIEAETVPRIAPVAKVLLQTKGAAQSRLFLTWLAAVESAGLDLIHCPSETFESAHFRLQGSRADRTPPRRLSGLA
jgi:Protein of unknown function (DUF2840)